MADKLSFMKFISYILNVCLCGILIYNKGSDIKQLCNGLTHAKNILVHNGTLMIANLGLAKELTTDGSSNSAVYGIPAYVKPQCYKYGDYVKMQSLISIVWVFSYGK
ncbi:unnamed protein product [Rhizophagus irregularis]|nr:unnamed protein product [Rhizophagus irregularis]